MTGRSESRSAILERFRAMMARGEPIIGGGAGTGLSAKCEEAGGIDLIVMTDGCFSGSGEACGFRWRAKLPDRWPD